MNAVKRLIASCSFGKDSLAAIITAEAHGIHIDEAVYCRIMFDDEISAELPEHEDFIHNKAIPLLWSRYGIKTTIVQAKKTYCDQFFAKYEKGERAGMIYGFPILRGPWCNSRLKVRPIEKWQKTVGEYTAVVGIAADETKRKNRDTVNGKLLPLVQYGVTEAEAFEICKRGGVPLTCIQQRTHPAGLLVLPQPEDQRVETTQERTPGTLGPTSGTGQGKPADIQTRQNPALLRYPFCM